MEQTTIPLASEEPTLPLAPGSAYLVLLVPSDEEERSASAMENWFQACASDEPFSLELVGTRREQGFVLRASSEAQLVHLCKQFAAQYPQAEIQRIAPSADPLLLRESEQALVGEFALTQPPFLPLKTFSGKTLAEPGADPLAGLLAAMEPLGSGQRVITQLALARAPDHWIARYIRKSVEHPLQSERDARMSQPQRERAMSADTTKWFLALLGFLLVATAVRGEESHVWLPFILVLLGVLAGFIGWVWWTLSRDRQEVYDMKLVAEKLSRPAFYTSLRVIVIGAQSTSTQEQLQAHLTRLEVAYRQLSLASSNSLFLKRTQRLTALQHGEHRLTTLQEAFLYRGAWQRLLHRGAMSPDIWNGLELAGAFHLPQAGTDLPLVRRLCVKHLLASPELARQISRMRAPLPPALIGSSQHRGYSVPVYLPFATLFRHSLLIARSRYGKSTLLQLLARAAMQPVTDGSLQPGLFLIDPHGDLIEALLTLIPPARAKDVLLLDLTDTQAVVALNPLDASMGFTRDQAVANIMSSFERIWSDFWGPRMQYFLKNMLLLLYTLNQQKVQQGRVHEQYTLLDINPLLQYPDYSRAVLAELDSSDAWHQELLAWWNNVYFALPRQSSFRNEVIMPIISKLGTFNDHQHLRRIVGQPVTHAPVQTAITEGKIVLCALSAREMDDAALNILGSTILNLLHRAFRTQQEVPQDRRRPVWCAADEFQAFSGGDFDRLLSEDAKFGCSLILSTQSLKRLNKIRDGLQEAVFTNCDNLFTFNVSAADAKLLEEELRGVIEQKYIMSQPRLHCYARLALPEQPLQTVSVALATPASWHLTPEREQAAQAIRRASQQSRTSADDIDRQHAEHLKHFLDVEDFAQELRRDVRAAQASRQRREEAERLAHEANTGEEQPSFQTTGSGTGARQQQASSSHNQRRTGLSQPPRQTPGETPEQDGTPASMKSSLAGGTSAGGASSDEEAGLRGARNHERTKRKGAGRRFGRGDQLDPLGEEEPHPRPPLGPLGGRSFWGSERERRE